MGVKFSFLAEESAILLHTAVLGLEMGLVYDFFRSIRRVWRSRFWASACMDLLFWGFTAWQTFFIMHTYSNGTLRWFAVLGVLTVVGIYLKWFSRYTVGTAVFVLSKVKALLDFLKKCLTKILKMSIIKIGIRSRKGDKHGKKSSISDEVSQ